MGNFTLVGIDPGDRNSGFLIYRYGEIKKAGNSPNKLLFNIMLDEYTQNSQLTVLIEDVKPYAARLGQQLIDTCKFLGQMEYRLETAGIAFKLIPRNTIKKWVFDTFPDVVIPRIDKEIRCRDRKRKDGEYFTASSRFVNDRMVIAAMKKKWSIPDPKPGKTNKYGLKDHSWQALALVGYYLDRFCSHEAGTNPVELD